MLNKIIVMGRLGKDPELRRTGTGKAVATFPIACDRDYAPNGGEKETDWLDITAWGKTAEFVEQYFTKGRMAIVSGRLQIRTWTDKEGNKRRNAEIVADNIYFGDSKNQGGENVPYGTLTRNGVGVNGGDFQDDYQEVDVPDDELPF